MKKFLLALPIGLLLVLAGSYSWWARDASADPSWIAPPRVITDPQTASPYRMERVFIMAGRNQIAATLIRPADERIVPVMLVVSGSGTGILPAESPLHRRLVAQGYGVLTLGKPGVGASSGDWRDEDFYDRANNVRAALDWLSARADIDAGRTILFGHSQGAYVIPIIADDERVQGLILAAGSPQAVREQIAGEQYATALREGAEEDQALTKAASTARFLDILLSGCPLLRYHYLCSVYRFDPAAYLSGIDKPVLALFAERDVLVPPARDLEPMRRLLASNPLAGTHVIGGANHLFWDSGTGLASEYASLIGPEAGYPFSEPGNPDHARLARSNVSRVRFAHGYFETIEAFLQAHVAVEAGS